MKLIFATNNRHKLEEIRAAFAVLPGVFGITGLAETGFTGDIPETGDSLEANAMQKAQYIFDRFGVACFADDTGLEIDALGGRPGVYAARYAGEGCSFDDNIDKVLLELDGETDRRARFRTVICLLLDGSTHYFEGKVEGHILTERRGNKGFGYDPVFVPDGYEHSFAEMDLGLKNSISHRGEAVRRMIAFFREQPSRP